MRAGKIRRIFGRGIAGALAASLFFCMVGSHGNGPAIRAHAAETGNAVMEGENPFALEEGDAFVTYGDNDAAESTVDGDRVAFSNNYGGYWKNDHKAIAVIKKDNTLWMWGSNKYGQLGDGTMTDCSEPTQIMEDVKSVAVGKDHCAALKTDGTLWTWGCNSAGQLGNGNQNADLAAAELKPVQIMEDVKAVCIGNACSAAIKTDNSLWMWGSNTCGRLGQSGKDISIPVEVMKDVESVSFGALHSAAIKTDGSLWTWGDNSRGQLGNGTMTDSSVPVRIMNKVKSVSLGATHSAAIKTDGSLWIWGPSDYGQLGDGQEIEEGKVRIITRPTQILDGVKKVTLGATSSAAVKTDNSLWMWGYAIDGIIEENWPTNDTDRMITKPVKMIDNVESVLLDKGSYSVYQHASLNASLTCNETPGRCVAVVKKDGSLWIWGNSWFGDKYVIEGSEPVQIMPSGSISVSGSTEPDNPNPPDPDDPDSEEIFITEATGPVIKVVDIKGKPIKNATVIYRSGIESQQTSSKGIAQLSSKNYIPGHGMVIMRSGYVSRIVDSFVKDKTGINTYVLQNDPPQANFSDVLDSVLLVRDREKTDLLTEEAVINRNDGNEAFAIMCMSRDNQYDSYTLYSGNKKVAENTHGDFAKLYPKDFSENQPVYLSLQGEGGEPLRKELNLYVTNFSPPVQELSLVDDQEIPIGDKVPFMTGQKVTISLDELPIEWCAKSDGTVIAGINLGAIADNAVSGTGIASKVDSVKRLTKDNVSNFLRKNRTIDKYASGINPEFQVIGYLESNAQAGQELYLQGKLFVAFSVELEHTQQMSVGPVPTVVEISLKGEVNADGTFKLSAEEGFTGSLGIGGSVGASLYAGPGVQGIVSAGVYGKLTFYLHYIMLPEEDRRVNEMYFAGELGLRAEVLSTEVAYALLDGTLYIVGGDSASAQAFALDDYDAYKSMDRSYLNADGTMPRWTSNGEVGANGNSIERTLQNAAYFGAVPRVVRMGDTVMLLYLTDAGAGREDNDRSMLVYSLWDENTENWSEPKAVLEDDGTADFNPDIYSDGDKIYTVWQEAKGSLAGLSLEEMTERLALHVAVYDAQKEQFVDLGLVESENGLFQQRPQIVADDGDVAVYWYENAQDNVLGLSGTNRIYRASLTAGDVLENGIQAVSASGEEADGEASDEEEAVRNESGGESPEAGESISGNTASGFRKLVALTQETQTEKTPAGRAAENTSSGEDGEKTDGEESGEPPANSGENEEGNGKPEEQESAEEEPEKPEEQEPAEEEPEKPEEQEPVEGESEKPEEQEPVEEEPEKPEEQEPAEEEPEKPEEQEPVEQDPEKSKETVSENTVPEENTVSENTISENTVQINTYAVAERSNRPWTVAFLQEEGKCILSADAGRVNGRTGYAYAAGTLDQTYQVEEGSAVLLTGENEVETLKSGKVEKVEFSSVYKDETATWYESGNIGYVDGNEIKTLFDEGRLPSPSYVLLSDGAKPEIIYLLNADGKTNLYRIGYENDAFLPSLPITDNESSIQYVGGFIKEDKTILVYNKMEVDDELKTVGNSLCTGTIAHSYYDAAMQSAGSMVLYNEETGENELKIAARIYNNGTGKAESLSLFLYGPDGSELESVPIEAVLEPGEEKDIFAFFSMDQIVQEAEYTLTLSGEEEANKENNSVKIALGGASLQVAAKVISVADTRTIHAGIENTGVTSCGGTVSIRDSETGEEYYRGAFEPIERGKKAVVEVEIAPSAFKEKQELALEVVVIPAQETVDTVRGLAKAYAPSYEVNFVTDTTATTVYAGYGAQVSFPENPKKEGKYFIGWYNAQNPAEGTLYTEETAITKAVTLYACFADEERTQTPLSECSVSAIPMQFYTGKALKPKVTVKWGSEVLKENRDYKVTYRDNKEQGTATAVITAAAGTGKKYAGSIERSFSIMYPTSKVSVKAIPAVNFTGDAHTPEPVVTYQKKTLVKDKDYTVSYFNNRNAGTAGVTVTGKGTFSGTKTVTFRIKGTAISGMRFDKISDVTYNAGNTRPIVTVSTKDGKTQLMSGSDYRLVYENTVNKGTATVTVIGNGNYTGTKKLTYKVVAKPLVESMIAVEQPAAVSVASTEQPAQTSLVVAPEKAEYAYTGKAIKPVLAVTDEQAGDTELVLNRDYTVSYSKNKAVGEGRITVKGKGNYNGTVTVPFTISPVNLVQGEKDGTIEVRVNDIAYTGKALRPAVQVYETVNGKEKKLPGSAYTISYRNNTEKGTGTVTVTGKEKSGYTGKVTADFRIVDQAKLLTASAIKIDAIPAQTFTGSALEPALHIADKSDKTREVMLVRGTDYEVAYRNNVNAGKATVTVKGIGSYAGSRNITFKINKCAIADKNGLCAGFAVENPADMKYTGYALKPDVVIKDQGKTLEQGKDYKLSYRNNTKIGTAAITVQGMGNYSGSYKAVRFRVKAWDYDTLTAEIGDQTYTGKALKPQVTFYMTGEKGREEILLKPNTAVKIAYRDNKKAGTATATITGKGELSGIDPITVMFEIERADLGEAVVSRIQNQTLKGAAVKPVPKVKVGRMRLKVNRDFTASYIRNGVKGEATVIIRGVGNYTGECRKTFIVQ